MTIIQKTVQEIGGGTHSSRPPGVKLVFRVRPLQDSGELSDHFCTIESFTKCLHTPNPSNSLPTPDTC